MDLVSSTHVINGFELDIYPNPVSQLLHIKTPQIQYLNYKLYDAQSKLIVSGKLQSTIQTDYLESGIYILKISDKDCSVSIVEQLIVLH